MLDNDHGFIKLLKSNRSKLNAWAQSVVRDKKKQDRPHTFAGRE
jgi:hypothetical protein